MSMKTYALDAISVLVVEDNRFMRSILVNVIKGLGVTHVQEARDGQEALEELRNNAADIIVMDWELDGMSGAKLLQTVRGGKRGLNPLTPVIVVSANTIARNVLQARDTGMTEFLAKPVSAAAIYARIVSIIENPRRFVRTGSYFGPDRRRRFDPIYKGPRRRADDRSMDAGKDVDVRSQA
ncbi:response regulator [Thalassobaculum sp. OXR-137]|uniref:response regulator n=1 Tax=Thalassobaculum sp. OXR-137 TaxID=3100173 RepID=UPI002AC8FD97|nr:response regulator [Thalassobaculum sp. OXR-137]WPZ36014.1 response regulator [Thalassobaculum sp. OXR-137]